MKSVSKTCTTIVQLALGTLILAMVLRTWLVMGLIAPVTVAGSSMAPTLLGPHVSVECLRCQHSFDVGAEFAAEADQAVCPQCGFAHNPLEGLLVHRGERLLIDRIPFNLRLPLRWEVVVFVSPADDAGLVVKRVVGLPGETIQLRDGEVWIDGRLAAKPLDAQRCLRRLVHQETASSQHWRGDGWNWINQAWSTTAQPDWHWLNYQALDGKPITDDSAYNVGLTRRLFPVRDFSLSTEYHLAGDGELAFRIADGDRQWQFQLKTSSGEFELVSETESFCGEFSTVAKQALHSGEVQLELSNCDRQLLVVINGRVEFRHELGELDSASGTATPFSVGVRNLTVSLRDLRLYRDVYYTSGGESLRLDKQMAPLLLGKNEVYVLGDNAPVSLDSRHWGPLPVRMLVGRPVGVR